MRAAGLRDRDAAEGAENTLATNSAIPRAADVFAYLRGSWSPFSVDKLRALYGDKIAFRTGFESAAKRGVAALVAEASDSWPGAR